MRDRREKGEVKKGRETENKRRKRTKGRKEEREERLRNNERKREREKEGIKEMRDKI